MNIFPNLLKIFCIIIFFSSLIFLFCFGGVVFALSFLMMQSVLEDMDVLPFDLRIPLNFQPFPGINKVLMNSVVLHTLNGSFSISSEKWNFLSRKYAF